MYTLLQLLVLMLLLIVGANPISHLWGTVVGDFVLSVHPLLRKYIDVWDTLLRVFSLLTGMEMPATYVSRVKTVVTREDNLLRRQSPDIYGQCRRPLSEISGYIL
jgi:hypothetical protein